MKQKIIYMAMAIFLACVIEAPCFAAGNESVSIRQGFYAGAMFINNDMNGDFDNTRFYTTSTMAYDVPDLGSGTGFGLVIGNRRDNISYELGYRKTGHDTRSLFTDVGDRADYNVVDVNVKFDVFSKTRLRPYALIGIGLSWLTVEDSATDGMFMEDETFKGYCLNVGAGVAYFFKPQWAVTGGLLYRWNTYNSIESARLDEKLKETAMGFELGMTYTF